MNVLSLTNVSKTYQNHRAVNNVSFNVEKGSIFGLLGPNGAGKTSLIRMITMITGVDEGSILLDGESLRPSMVADIGYMPEERGLYKKMKVGEQLMYLAQLRGLQKSQAKKDIKEWLEKFDAGDWWSKKIEELSKGMQQKIQFIATVLHKPKLLILDEPFTGLDPLNTNLIKEEIHKMNREGVSIIFSTHRMEQVEEICRDIVLINSGELVLQGEMETVKQQFKENHYRIQFDGNLPSHLKKDSFDIISDNNDALVIAVKEGHDSNELLQSIIREGIHISAFNEILPSLNEIFIKKVNKTI